MLAVLIWAPLPFASNRPWATALLFAALLLLLCGHLVSALKAPRPLLPQISAYAVAPLLMLLSVQVWVVVQWLPLPAEIVETLSPRAAEWQSGRDMMRVSLDPYSTAFALLKGGIVCIGFYLVLVLVNSQRRLTVLLQALVLSGTAQALYGAFMVLSGLELGFFVEKYSSRGSATGTFVNRNHMAGYLVMCIAAGTGLMVAQLQTQRSRNWRERLRRVLEWALSPRIRLRIYLALMVIALVLTRSRMGNMAFFSALGIAGVLALASGRRFSPRLALLLASLVVIDVLILGQWFGFDRLAERVQETQLETEQRVWSNEYTLDLVADFPVTGSGAGSFYGVFPNYQADDLKGFHAHAHNDYLEFAADLGIPATLILGAAVLLCGWHGWRAQCERHNPLLRGAGFAVVMVCVWMLLHSLTDFNLQVPANALTFAVMLALGPICRGLSKTRRK